MNLKYKVTFAVFLILIISFLFWYLLIEKNNKIPRLTNGQKVDILSQNSNTPFDFMPEIEKKNILNKISTTTESTSGFSEEEKLELLNKTN